MEHANLSDRPLPAVFLDVSDAEEPGVVRCSRPRAELLFYYTAEGVTFLSRGELKISSLTDLLVAAQKITPMQITAVRNRTRSSGKHFGQVLVEMELLSRDELEEFLGRQYELTVAELLKWEDGTCEYGPEKEPEEFLDEQNPPARVAVPGFELARATAMIAGAWERIRFKAPTLDTVLALSSDKLVEIDSLPFPDEVKADVKYINGVRSIGEFLELATGSTFTTAAFLDKLLERGIVHPAAEPKVPEPKRPEPKVAAAKPEVKEKVRQVPAFQEPAVQAPPKPPPTKVKVPSSFEFQAEAEEKTGDRLLIEGRAALDTKDPDKAEKLFRGAMDLYNREGTQSGVIVALDELLEIKKGDLDLLAVKFQNLIEMNKAKEAEDVGGEIVSISKSHPFPNAPVRALEKVTRAFPDEMDYKVAFAEALSKNEERERAAAVYGELADGCESCGMRDPALRFFEKAQQLDRINARYSEAVKRLKKKKAGFRISGRLVGAIAGIIVLLIVLGAAGFYFLVYRPDAGKAFEEARQKVLVLLKADSTDFAGARRILNEVKNSYPMSGIESEVGEQLAMLTRQEAALTKPAEPEPGPGETPKPEPDRAARAKALLAKARELEGNGEYSTAFKLYQTLLKDFSNQAEAAEVQLPIRINTTPSGAEIFVNDRKIGVTSGIMHYRPDDVVGGYLEIDVRLRGFKVRPGQTSLFVSEFREVNIKLDKVPSWHWAIGRPVEVTPTVAGEVVACPTRAGVTYCFALTNRIGEHETAVSWHFKVGIFGDLVSELMYSDGFLYGSNTNRSVFSMNVDNRKLEWLVDIGASARAKPVLGSRFIGVGSNKGTFHLLDRRTGREVAKTELENRICAGAAYKRGVFYIGGTDNTVRAFNVNSKQIVWVRDMPDDVVADLTFANGFLLVPCVDGRLYALNTESGKMFWRFETHGKLVSAPVVDGENIFLTSADGNVYGLDLNGKEKWRFKTDRPIVSKPALGHERLYVTSTDARLYALDSREGKEIWRYAAEEAFLAGPVSASGIVVCVTKTGTVYAFED